MEYEAQKLHLSRKVDVLDKFLEPSTICTPFPLIEEIVDKLPIEWDNPSKVYLDPCCGRGAFLFVIKNRLMKYHSEQHIVENMLFGVDISGSNVKFAKTILNPGNKYNDNIERNNALTKDWKMKFDVVIGNPPYTVGSKPLYAVFFEKALQLGELAAFVFPIDLNSNNKKLKTVNQNIKKHSMYVSDEVSNQFNVSQPNIRYVIASRHVTNDVADYVDPLVARPLLYPTRMRIVSKRGSYAATIAKESAIGTRFIRSVLTTGVTEKTIACDYTQMLPDPYVVLVNYSMAAGRLQCTALKNKDVMWSYTTFAIPASSEQEANELCRWLSSKEIGDEMATMMKLKNVYTFSGPMLDRLPSYK